MPLDEMGDSHDFPHTQSSVDIKSTPKQMPYMSQFLTVKKPRRID